MPACAWGSAEKYGLGSSKAPYCITYNILICNSAALLIKPEINAAWLL